MLAVEADADANPGVVLHTRPPRLVLAVVFVLRRAVGFALDDKAAAASGHELLEDGGEFAGDLLEGALDSFVLALVQHGD